MGLVCLQNQARKYGDGKVIDHKEANAGGFLWGDGGGYFSFFLILEY